MNIASITISILALAVSISAFIYTIYKDNKESVILWCSCHKCIPNNNGFEFSGSYIITNNSHKNVSIIEAYVLYTGVKIPSNLNKSDTFPINLNAGQSYPISINFHCSSEMLNTTYFEVKVVSANQKKYSTTTSFQ